MEWNMANEKIVFDCTPSEIERLQQDGWILASKTALPPEEFHTPVVRAGRIEMVNSTHAPARTRFVFTREIVTC